MAQTYEVVIIQEYRFEVEAENKGEAVDKAYDVVWSDHLHEYDLNIKEKD